MELDGTLFVTRRQFLPWLASRLPRDHLIGVEYDFSIEFRYDRAKEAQFAGLNGNVLNAGMFPVGAFLSDELILLRFGGKDPKVAQHEAGNRFFWSHDEKSSIAGWEDRIVQVNPAVFARDFEAYHQMHNVTAKYVIGHIRSESKMAFRLNGPFISALAELTTWHSSEVA